jgi:Spy/CpxP family protein refolding chaperone
MKAIKFIKIYAYLAVLIVFAAGAAAQDGKPPDGQPDGQRPAANQPQDDRGNALRQLGLSREQVQQIRRINIERKPLMDEAQKRFREANRALDEAIYADNVNDADFQARLKDVHAAQAEVARIRFMNELSVRKVLTPEQLVRFREIRRNFEQAQQNIQNQNNREGMTPRQERRQLIRQGLSPQRPLANPNKQRPIATPIKEPIKH